ncbi:MAG: TonB-dependent receptor, partial [Odoribacter sp.]
IVVERKKLTVGNMKVAYNFTGNVQFPYLKDYDVLNAQEKLEFEHLAGLYTAEGQKNQWGEPLENKAQYGLDSLYNMRQMEVNRGVNSDWLSQPARVAFSHDHSLRLYGGASNIRYELNGRFNNTQGVMKEDYRRRYNLGFQLQYHIQDKLTLANRTSYTEINTKDSPYGAFSKYTLMNPYDRMYDEFGHPNTKLSWNQNNPLYEAKLGNRTSAKEKTFYNNTDIRWEINSLFRVNATFNITVTDGSGERFLSPDSQVFKNETDNSKKGSMVMTGASGSSYSGTLVGAFNKTTENNSLISVNAGFEVRHEHSETSLMKGLGFYNNELDFIGQGAGYPTTEHPQGTQTLSSEIGGFINGNYMYNNRYYADFVYRLTGSSKFGTNNRYGHFWSGGIGWNLNNESFLQSDKIDLLKLRASAGYTGKVTFESFQAMTIYRYSGDLEYRNGIGATPITIGNEDLKWERELSYNIGTDISLFGRRLNLTFDAYLKRTTDLLLDESKAPSTGVITGKENIGEMKNKGIEFQIDGFPIQSNDFYWQLSFTGYCNRNKIEKISTALKEENNKNNNAASLTPLGQYEEGESVTALKVVRSAGIDPATGEEVYYKLNGERTFEYNPDDKVVIGDMEPKFRGNVSTNLYYKGFSLYILGTFKCGGYLYNATRASKIEGADPKSNVDQRAFDERWKNPGDIALYKNIAINKSIPKQTDRFVEKENVFTLSTLNVGYEFNQNICSKLYVRNLRLGVNLTDLFRISNVKIERGTDYLYSNGFEFTLSTTF